jgi:hypothetical protein
VIGSLSHRGLLCHYVPVMRGVCASLCSIATHLFAFRRELLTQQLPGQKPIDFSPGLCQSLAPRGVAVLNRVGQQRDGRHRLGTK